MENASNIQINSPKLWQTLLPKLKHDSNKYSRGYAMIYGGYPITGAARLAALACARTGAGMTSILSPEIAFPIYASNLLSIMVRPFASHNEMESLAVDPRISAFLIGPGAGVNAHTRHATLSLLSKNKPTVIDADALTVFENNVDTLKQAIKNTCVLTPHEGEFKRLFKLGNDHTQSVAEAAKKLNAIILLKGHQTIIASADGKIVINQHAPVTLATAGSGDVLAGIITGLLAQGMPAFEASCAAVWMHSEAANLFGPGLIADDLPTMLLKVIHQLSTYH